MDLNQIRLNAPVGATHYKIRSSVDYYRIEGDFIYVWFNHPAIKEFVRYLPLELARWLDIKPLH